MHGSVPAVSLDPLPPPPLPDQPAVGPDTFSPSSHDDPAEGNSDSMDIKPVHRFIPDSVKNFFRGNSSNRGSKGKAIPPPSISSPHSPAPSSRKSDNCHTTGGVPCSPPHSAPPSPSLPGSYWDRNGSSGASYNKEHDGLLLGAEALSSVPTNLSAQTYQERVEEYHLRYAYMKSWAGLLRILGCVELLLGAAVFACVCAYVHKDNEWFNMYGYSGPQLYGGLGGDIMDTPNNPVAAPTIEPEILQGHIPAGYIPKPVVIADYVAKYPSIRSEEERDQYKAVFNDQYAEYKELHSEVQAMATKFEEMDEMIQNLPSRPSSQMDKERISGILMEYQRKKADPNYLEKRERCEYLKNKLSHIKQKIHEYNKVADWNGGK
ncbi:hypothetical protein F2P81_025460 [Scophthalmus maximus]|uniref:OCEL domain-containing protein n=1 Tax=Scophthalmus maximus TaxID=52904 RepID=A0A6A4RUR8_SCOMX|nr:hypothetical protein F2P81_025460 [Scophthalmus maximus]